MRKHRLIFRIPTLLGILLAALGGITISALGVQIFLAYVGLGE
jgi:hypothetical protein